MTKQYNQSPARRQSYLSKNEHRDAKIEKLREQKLMQHIKQQQKISEQARTTHHESVQRYFK